MKSHFLWHEQAEPDGNALSHSPYRVKYRVEFYDARTLHGGDYTEIHNSLITARMAAFFGAIRGDRRVVVVPLARTARLDTPQNRG